MILNSDTRQSQSEQRLQSDFLQSDWCRTDNTIRAVDFVQTLFWLGWRRQVHNRSHRKTSIRDKIKAKCSIVCECLRLKSGRGAYELEACIIMFSEADSCSIVRDNCLLVSHLRWITDSMLVRWLGSVCLSKIALIETIYSENCSSKHEIITDASMSIIMSLAC